MTPIPFEHIELKIMEAGFDRVDNSWNRFITLFPYYRIYYVVSGKAVIYLQDYQLNLKPGKLYFIPSFSIFDAHCDEILGHYWIHFNFDITTASYLTIYPPKREAEAPPFVGEIFRNLLQHVGGYQQCNSPADAIACEGLIKYLLSFFLPDTVSAAPEAVRFVPVLQYIDSHFDSHISNADLGKIMFLSPTYFSNLFTKQFGITPQQYIQQKRTNAAAIMLFESNKNIREIAFACGFESETYFNRQFHNYMGISPGKYRKLAVSLGS